MKKLTLLSGLALLAFASSGNIQNVQEKQATPTLSAEAINALQAKGFNFIGMHRPVRSPRLVDSTNLAETVHIQMSLDLNAAKDIDITWLGARLAKATTASPNDTILTEGFEGDFPENQWKLSGNPTWGKSNYQKHSGQNSVFCAKGGTSGVTPPANYPNNMNAMMIFGPFDLTGASLAFVRFWYWLDTEINKDWFYYMASMDGVNFRGIGVSGATGVSSPAWEQTSLNLGDVSQLGNLTGKSSVWIAFGFASDSTNTRPGVFIDDIELQKFSVGTGLSGYIKGALSPTGNPYIAFDHIGVAKRDSLKILPGTEIRFDQGIELVVEGRLNARGTVNDSLRFTSNNKNPKPGDWAGIGFYLADTNATVRYARIDYAGKSRGGQFGAAGILADGRPVISNNLIIKNVGAGISCIRRNQTSPTIRQNKVSHNTIGIQAFESVGLIEGNVISNNRTGISMISSGFIVRNNHIRDNSEIGISCNTSEPVIVKNIIENNGSDGIWAGEAYLLIPTFVRIIGNQILNNKTNGIRISGFAYRGKILANLIKGNHRNGVDFSGISNSYPTPLIDLVNNTHCS